MTMLLLLLLLLLLRNATPGSISSVNTRDLLPQVRYEWPSILLKEARHCYLQILPINASVVRFRLQR